MTRMIEYEGIPCKVYTTSETTVAPGGPDLPKETAIYAAWRWLGHCKVLFHPLTALCLAFRRGLVRGHTLQMEVSLPARLPIFPPMTGSTCCWSSPARASGSSRWSFLPARCWPVCPAACGVWCSTETVKKSSGRLPGTLRTALPPDGLPRLPPFGRGPVTEPAY